MAASTGVLDASALLCFLRGEPGSDVVERELRPGAVCSAVNWSEVAQKVLASAEDWSVSRQLLLSYGLAVADVTVVDAEWAARAFSPGSGLSIADRLCLALAERLDRLVWTADTAWGVRGRVRQIR